METPSANVMLKVPVHTLGHPGAASPGPQPLDNPNSDNDREQLKFTISHAFFRSSKRFRVLSGRASSKVTWKGETSLSSVSTTRTLDTRRTPAFGSDAS